MITLTDIEALAQRHATPGSPVLSVYLDIDQSKAVNLHRRFEATLENMLRAIDRPSDPAFLSSFSADAERVRQYVAHLEPRAKGLICFADDSEKFFWTWEIKAPVHNLARWSETPYIAPLLAILDEHERYGVVLADKQQARLFTVYIGEIEEHMEALAPAPVRLTKSTGTDHMLSERRFQSKAEMHVHWHLKHVAEMLNKLVDQYGFDRLLLAGPVETTAELHRLLSKRVAARVVERLSLTTKATASEVLQETLRVEQQVERATEKQLVEELIAADGHNPVTLGIEPTVRAVCEERLWRLVYADGFSSDGGQCTNCSMLFAKTQGSCDYCGGAIKRIDDLLEVIIERSLQQDGNVEEVEGEAASRLQQVGGIGAVLRF